MFVGDKEYFIENCIHVPCLNTCRSKTSEKPSTFYIENVKLRCCVVYTNCSTKNPNLSFHRVHDEWLQNIKRKEPLPKNFYICSEDFEKDYGYYGYGYYGFSLYCNSSSHLKTFFKNISQFSVKIFEKTSEIVVFLIEPVAFSLKFNFVTMIFQVKFLQLTTFLVSNHGIHESK